MSERKTHLTKWVPMPAKFREFDRCHRFCWAVTTYADKSLATGLAVQHGFYRKRSRRMGGK